MKKRPYYFEIKNLITQFIGAFNDIAIKRYNADRISDGKDYGVGFLYSPKQRVIEDILNKSRQIPLPAISISIQNISRDLERVFNKLDGHSITTTKDSDYLRKIPQPIPINITINMSIIARYQQDIEQIISNFAPYCDPYITVSWKLPTTENTSYEKEIRTVIEWSGSVNLQYPIELSSNQLARITGDTTFTIKGWLFKHIDDKIGKIFTIHSTYIPNITDEGCLVYDDITESFKLILEKDTLIQRGKPTLKNIDYVNYFIGITDTLFEYNLYGKDFFEITDFYLLSETPNLLPNYSFHNPFKDTDLESTYPGFYGSKINTFTVNSYNNISFTIPFLLKTPGIFDILIKNKAGYSILSIDSLLPPHTTDLLKQVIPIPYQPPCTEGIKVILPS